MIDLSDGLAGDLRHLLERSQVGAELLARSIPISRAARARAGTGTPPKPPLVAALTDGEDYELLFTVAARDAVPLADAWRKQFPKLRLSCIGQITAARGLKLRDDTGRSRPPRAWLPSFRIVPPKPRRWAKTGDASAAAAGSSA